MTHALNRITSDLNNIVLNSDSYNYGHYLQYPDDTVALSHHGGPRKGAWGMDTYIPALLQAFLKEFLSVRITHQMVDEAETVLLAHSGYFNSVGWRYIVDHHDGILPVYIEAIPEGRPTSIGVPMFQLWSTDPKVAWVGAWLETMILRGIWYGTTVATKTYRMKLAIIENMRDTCETLDGLPYKLVDFGARGTTGLEAAALGGVAVQMNFAAADNLSGIVGASRWYGMNTLDKMRTFSVPAASHGTISSWGVEGETDGYSNMLKQFGYKPGAKVAVVSDIRNLWEAIEFIWGGTLKADVDRLAEFGSCLIIRPDSGVPKDTVKRALNLMGERFGIRDNNVGYKLLPDHVRLIQGDGVGVESLDDMLGVIKTDRWSLDNINFGSGGEILQALTRDTLSCAMKQNARQTADGVWHDNSKCPVDDPGKASFAGRQAVVHENGRDITIRLEDLGDRENILKPVWLNGKLLREDDLDVLRGRTGLWL